MDYRKLTRKKRTLTGSTQLWLGGDHVLMVRSSRFVEEYRRFQLADIQALVACETPPRLALQIVLIVGAVLAFVGMASADHPFGRGLLAFAGASLLAMAAYDLARGQRCRCRLLTEVSAEQLDPVTRASDYRRLLAALTPEIEAVQGSMPVEPGELAGLPLREAFAHPGDASPEGFSRYLPHALFGILLANVFVYAMFYLWRMEEGLGLAISVMVAEFFLTGLLLAGSKRFGIEGALKTLIGAVAAALALDLISGLSQTGLLIYSIAEAGRNNAAPPKLWDFAWMVLAGKISMAWRAFAAITGFLLLHLGRETKAEAPPSQL